MKPNRWQQVEQLYHSALEQEANQRADFLKAACAGDQALHREVESLLRLQPQAESFIEEPAVEAVAHVMAQSRTQSLVGRQIGSYQILSLLGVGGMGEVYKARDTRLDRIDALKILPSEVASDRERLRRFVREAKAASALKHPNVATIYEIGESAGLHFIAMEYVEGQTLESKISSQPLDPAEVVEIGLQITDALDEAHSKGITHRDIKPANLMLTPRGQVKVLDFGLAKVARPEGQAVASDITTDLSTASGVLMGTMHYMSPEQVLGQKPDHRTDIFSLGAVLYEMATGRLPFAGTSSTETMDRILHGQPEAMAQFNYNLPVELERIIRKCLEKDRERRYQSARELLIDLKNLKRDSALVAIPARRAKLVPVLGGLGAAVLAAALWYGISKLGRETDKPGKTLAHAAFTQLTNQPGEECFPSLSPDGRLVVYASRAAGNWDIYLLRIGGQNPINLTKGSLADDTQGVFSPDGDFIAFRSERDGGGIFVMGATGESVKRLTDFGYNPAWSPDGSRIVLATQGFDIPSSRGLLSQLWTVTVATDSIRQVTMVRDAVQPSWSPHGDRIAFWGSTVSGQRDIWTIPSSGGEVIPVTSDSALDWNPVWSPDGKFLYFCSDRGGSMNLWRVPIEERSGRVLREPEPVTTGGGGAASRQNLSISRDGAPSSVCGANRQEQSSEGRL